MYHAGIDEAGRGPMLGPLVTCLVVLDDEGKHILAAAGVTDSKKLSAKKREHLAGLIREHARSVHLVSADPERIDAALADPLSNLNLLEAELTAELLAQLSVEPVIVAIDLPTRDEAGYRSWILARSNIGPGTTLLLEHKADLNHTACAAASIIAKVERDRAVHEIGGSVGVPVGSGYPSDPRTRAFLESHGRSHAHLFRRTWATYTERYAPRGQRTLM